MAEIIALSRNLNLLWLNETAEYHLTGYTREEAAEKLDHTISNVISAKDNIRKTRTLLLRIWYDADSLLKDQASQLYKSASADEKLAIHWAMMLDKFPVFYDLCEVIGHLFAFRDEIALSQIKQRIFEKWGARETLVHALSKNMQTLKDIGIVTMAERSGVYCNTQHMLADPKIIGLLIAAMLRANDQKYISWEAFISHPIVFPFKTEHVSEADVASLHYLCLDRIGSSVVLVLRS